MKSKNKVEISKINIKIGDKSIELSLEEAQELRQILDETFGQKTVFYPSAPIIIERPYIRPRQWWEGPTVTWTTGDSAVITLSTAGTSQTLSDSSSFADPDVIPVM